MHRTIIIAAALCLCAISLTADTWHYRSIEHKGYEASGCGTAPVLTFWDDVNQRGHYYKIQNISVSKMDDTRKEKEGGLFEEDQERTWRNEARSVEFVGRWEVCTGDNYSDCTSLDSRSSQRQNLPSNLDEKINSVRLLGCYDGGGGFKNAELPRSMKLCMTAKQLGSGWQKIAVRAVDGDGRTMGQECEIGLQVGAEACCDTGYKGFRRPAKIEFDVKQATTDARLLQITNVSYDPDPSAWANYENDHAAEINGFAGVWLKEHTMCGMGWFGTCEAADAGMFDAKYDLFHSFAVGTERACEGGYIEVGNSCGMNAGAGTRVVCKKTNSCANNQRP